MGRAQGNNRASAGSRRRGTKLPAEARAFINGTSDKVTLVPGPVALGAEWALANRRGGGAHGKSGRARHKSDRAGAKGQLSHGEY